MQMLGATDDIIAQVTDITAIVTPFLPLVGTIIGGIVIGAFAVWNRKRGALEERAPDVNEAWAEARLAGRELDEERRWRRRLQNFAWELRAVFKGYVNRVQAGGSTDLNGHEQLFFDAEPPTSETNLRGGG